MQTLRPQLAELLRTCLRPPLLFLQVAHTTTVDAAQDRHDDTSTTAVDSPLQSVNAHRHATKLVLTDGELMIQALLHRKLSTLHDQAKFEIGDFVTISEYKLKKATRLDHRGKVLYLAIENCAFLHRRDLPDDSDDSVVVEDSSKAMSRKRKNSLEESTGTGRRADLTQVTQDEIAGSSLASPRTKRQKLHPEGHLEIPSQKREPFSSAQTHIREQTADNTTLSQTVESNQMAAANADMDKMIIRELQGGIEKSRTETHRLGNTFGARRLMVDEDDEDDFFEPVDVDRIAVTQRRQALQRLDANISGVLQLPVDNTKREAVVLYVKEQPVVPLKVQPRPLVQPLLPSPPFHSLHSLRNPPPSQPVSNKNYILTTLAFITWAGTTLIHRPGSPFPPKRHIKIIDPCLSSSRPSSRQAVVASGDVTAGAIRRSINNIDRKLEEISKSDTEDKDVQCQEMELLRGRLLAKLEKLNSGREGEASSPSFQAQTLFQDAVTVAVYLDAAQFNPSKGTLALFRGLVMQRLENGDVILNAYARLKDQRFEGTSIKAPTGESSLQMDGDEELEVEDEGMVAGNTGRTNESPDSHWFITDHDRIRALGYGSKLDYYLEWWKERQEQGKTVK